MVKLHVIILVPVQVLAAWLDKGIVIKKDAHAV